MHKFTKLLGFFITLLILVSCSTSTSKEYISTRPEPTSTFFVTPIFETATPISTTLRLADEEITYGQEQGEIILAAIEMFYQETDRYPEELDELSPLFLDEIPLTLFGDEFEYEIEEPSGANSWNPYILRYKLVNAHNVVCHHWPNYKQQNIDKWQCEMESATP